MVVAETVVANKTKIGRAAALAMARAAEVVIAAKGKKLVRLRLADRPTDDELVAVLLGPSGNLRAPAMRVGKVLVIGFHPEPFAELFG